MFKKIINFASDVLDIVNELSPLELTKAEKIKALENIIKDNYNPGSYLIHYNSNISTDTKEKISQYFISLNQIDFVAFVDSTIFNSCKTGILFSLKGIYIREVFDKKAYYINYKDMNAISCNSDGFLEKGNVNIVLKNGNTKTIISASNETLKTTLLQCCKEYNSWTDMISYKPSGEIGTLYYELACYEQASIESEIKLKKQAKDFITFKRNWQKERDDYDKLRDDLKNQINELKLYSKGIDDYILKLELGKQIKKYENTLRVLNKLSA